MEKKDGKGQETKVEEKTYSEVEHKGVISDLQKERQQRQQFGFELSQSQSKLAALEKENEELKRKAEEKESKKSVIEGEDDDVLTKKEGRTIEQRVLDNIKKAQEVVAVKGEKDRLDSNFQKSIITAKKKYVDRKDIGLDWETVYQAALNRLGGRKFRELDIYHSDNPGEELYEEGLKDPEIAEKLELAKNEKILDAMGNRKVDKKGLSGAGASDQGFTFERVSKMSQKEIQENLPAIQEAQKYWKK